MQAESFDQKFQRRISAITSGSQVADMSAHSLKVLTNDFEESYVQQVICKFSAPTDQLAILEAIEKAFDKIHIYDYNFNQPLYDKEIPAYFEQYRLDLELGVSITNEDVDIPTSATDPKFEDLCKSLIEQRNRFQQLNTSMSSFATYVDKGNDSYKKISAQLSAYDAKCKECDELRDKNKELTVQLDEAQKMNKKLAEKTDAKDVERIIRRYLTQSKNKSTTKKEHIKNIIDEMVNSANIELPDDLKSMLDSFDNETPAHIDKVDIFEQGSTKNENCKQLSVAPFATAEPVPWENVVPWEQKSGNVNFNDDDLPF